MPRSVASTSRFAPARFWLIITNVEKKIASMSDHRWVTVRVAFQPKPDPEAEAEHVQADEADRAAQRGDRSGGAVLDALAALTLVLDHRWVDQRLSVTTDERQLSYFLVSAPEPLAAAVFENEVPLP